MRSDKEIQKPAGNETTIQVLTLWLSTTAQVRLTNLTKDSDVWTGFDDDGAKWEAWDVSDGLAFSFRRVG